MTTYIVLSVLVIAFIYFNVLGLFKNIKDIPEGDYRDALLKYKKMEIIEKGVISLIFVAIIFSVKFTEEIAMVALAGMALMMIIEYFFGKYIRKSLVCPHCGGAIWNGNFIVLIQPFKWCPRCQKPLIDMPAEITADQNSEEENEDEKEQ